MPPEVGVVVVGGGIVGVAVAARLASDGHDVLIVDSGQPRFGSSLGNAGHIVDSFVLPFARPGMVASGLVSLARRDGAFALNPRHAGVVAPWLVRFARSCTAANVKRAAPALVWLSRASREALDELTATRTELSLSLRSNGVLLVYNTSRSLAAGRREAGEVAEYGIAWREVEAAEVLACSPRLRPGIAGAILFCDDRSLDPEQFWRTLADLGKSRGVRTMRATARRLLQSGSSVLVHTDEGTLSAGHVVVAAGAWSGELLAGLGVRLPLAAAKGYSVTLASQAVGLAGPMLLHEPHLALNPLESGLRITGRHENTSPNDRKTSSRRVGEVIAGARRYLRLDDPLPAEQVWTGNRPASADGFPVIGVVPSADRVVVCTGHGMTGTSTALGSASLVADLVARRACPPQLRVLAPGRP